MKSNFNPIKLTSNCNKQESGIQIFDILLRISHQKFMKNNKSWDNLLNKQSSWSVLDGGEAEYIGESYSIGNYIKPDISYKFDMQIRFC